MKRLQSYTAPGITVTFDPNLCIHSGVCLRTLPAVFDVGRRRWVQPESDEVAKVAATVERCPSGALQYRLETSPTPETTAEEPVVTAVVQASLNGPLLLEGPFVLLDEKGDIIRNVGRAALCRCGGTGNQPFCDGTHRSNGFRSKRAQSG